MGRRKRSDSIDAQIMTGQELVSAPPVDLPLNEAEMVVWDQMVKVRNEWRSFDLILLVKVVKLEVKIRDWWEMVERSGPMIRNRRETLIENPLLRSINTIQHQQLSIITKMHIMQGEDARAINNNAAQEVSAERVRRPNVMSLLATPSRARN